MHIFDNPHLACCEIDGELIFLDVAKDRFFQLTGEKNERALVHLDRRGNPRSWQPAELPRPPDYESPARASPDMMVGAFQLSEVARALWLQCRLEKRLSTHSLHSVLFDLHHSVRKRASKARASPARAAQTIRAFEHAKLIRTAVDRCLPRSIALSLALAYRGVAAHTVIGVKVAGFGAHCWTQAGDAVLNDSVEEVLRYRPILII